MKIEAGKILRAILAMVVAGFCSSAPALPTQQPDPHHALVAERPVSPYVRIVMPDRIDTDSMKLDFEYGPVSPRPRFKVQLDDSDAVITYEPGFTLSRLTPGMHILRVDLLDARGFAVPGAHAQTQFQIGGGPANSSALATGVNQPDAQGPLPLLSVVGFGVLLAGLISAMKTRPGR